LDRQVVVAWLPDQERHAQRAHSSNCESGAESQFFLRLVPYRFAQLLADHTVQQGHAGHGDEEQDNLEQRFHAVDHPAVSESV
jgi:hypothetical protein